MKKCGILGRQKFGVFLNQILNFSTDSYATAIHKDINT